MRICKTLFAACTSNSVLATSGSKMLPVTSGFTLFEVSNEHSRKQVASLFMFYALNVSPPTKDACPSL